MTPNVRKKQISVGLEPELRALLGVAAERNGHSIAEEIRARLHSSATETQDAGDLVAAVRFLAAEVQKTVGTSWRGSVTAHSALVAAINEYLDRQKPAFGQAAEDLLVHSSDDPATIGRFIARLQANDEAQRAVVKAQEAVKTVLDKLK